MYWKKKCKSEKGTCRWVGYVVTKKVGKKCAWKKVGHNAKRLRCCNFVKKCHSKLGKCKLLSKKMSLVIKKKNKKNSKKILCIQSIF